jgi:Asp-tRNA(Asn)/Glu-tRNA(Gln) amidotransferase A subunit family amidase
MDDQVIFMPATQAAALIRSRRLSVVDYVDAVLARCEAQQPRLNAFATLCPENARADAKRAQDAVMRGDTLGPLHGIPVSIKDLFATKGVRTAYGSAIQADNIPDQDDICVQRLRDAGAIIIGKSTTPEYGHKGITDSPLFGTTRNPWDPSRTSGGSSGGAGVAASYGLGPIALGSDGAGSIRIPAACCGVVGLKATTGAIPFEATQDTFGNNVAAGPLARTIADTALMTAVLAGPAECDPWSLSGPPRRGITTQPVGSDLTGLRIGYIRMMANPHLAADVEANTLAALDVFTARGAVVEEVTEAIDWIEYPGRILYQGGFHASLGPKLAEWRDQMDRSLVAFIERGSKFDLASYRQSQFARTRLYRAVQGLFGRYDFLVSPSLTRTALPADFDAAFDEVMVDGKASGITRQGWTSYAYPFNLTGHPAVSVPSGWGTDGLPTGVQIVGPWWSDEAILRLGAVIEQDRPWAHRRP